MNNEHTTLWRFDDAWGGSSRNRLLQGSCTLEAIYADEWSEEDIRTLERLLSHFGQNPSTGSLSFCMSAVMFLVLQQISIYRNRINDGKAISKCHVPDNQDLMEDTKYTINVTFGKRQWWPFHRLIDRFQCSIGVSNAW
ncbi:hypothetical protein AVEN_251472-1 [Araneus ventricosus]|uniref:Uncharacterized protein n=1 Tax=Araneus ventricosus TaxID=182803 RepID=A0A4Y2UGX7_ARAVE|nr:hypothetical protein AVEN_219887-1 [Araneus ventricosus]GBO11384.1 hypothetical protein AVEN_251472-1 [Araneus ventricosus]